MLDLVSAIHILGGGLAGAEAAWQIAAAGLDCVLFEMRPVRTTPAHKTDRLAELVCSNSLKSEGENSAPWLGQSFSVSRVCFPADGHIFKIITDAGPGGGNAPGWGDNDFVDPTSCVAAIDPRLR